MADSGIEKLSQASISTALKNKKPLQIIQLDTLKKKGIKSLPVRTVIFLA